ncbi:MAG: heme exporter protein CcmD [Gammaproteobacteria bacterium]|nr:heme exporter protein CcmD [Gammaproteobacteria bacterium]
MSEFFHMGGHGFYIWTSYTLVLIVFVYNYVSPIIKRKRLIQQIDTANKSAGRSKERDYINTHNHPE